MKAIVSLQRFAENYNKQPFIVWDKRRRDLNAHFLDLFEPHINVLPRMPKGIVESFRCSWFLWLEAQERTDLSNGIDFCFDEIPDSLIRQYAGYFERFRPVERLSREITRRKQLMSKDYVGVHIRRTDFVGRSLSSPADVSEFQAAIEETVQAGAAVFLATDCPETEQKILSSFGRGIETCGRQRRDRDSLKGMERAVTDLFLLAGSSRLIGSYGSTFTECAWWLAGAKLPVKILGGV